MVSAYCDPDWHDGAKVPADYRVRLVDVTSGEFATTTTFQAADRSWHESPIWCTCRQHVETALHIMLKRSPYVMVTAEEVD